jgi:hypothetical protein
VITLAEDEILVKRIVLVKVLRDIANHVLLYLSVIEILFPGILENDKG